MSTAGKKYASQNLCSCQDPKCKLRYSENKKAQGITLDFPSCFSPFLYNRKDINILYLNKSHVNCSCTSNPALIAGCSSQNEIQKQIPLKLFVLWERLESRKRAYAYLLSRNRRLCAQP